MSRRQKHCRLHMTNLFTRRRDIASCPWTKQSYLGKCSNGKLRTSTLVNNGTLRSTAGFSSALSNANNVKKSDLLEFLVMLLFFPLFSPENHLQKVAILWKHPRRFFFDNLKTPLVEVSLYFHLQLCKNIVEWLLCYENTFCNL